MGEQELYDFVQKRHREARLLSAQRWNAIDAFLRQYDYLEERTADGLEEALDLAGKALLRGLGPSDAGFWGALYLVATSPRCGVKEVANRKLTTSSRIQVDKSQGGSRTLSYWIQEAPPTDVTEKEMKRSIMDALEEWQSVKVNDVSVITFLEAANAEDAHIKFRWTRLGDGLYNAIGHANKAGLGSNEGIVSFDSDDSWTAVVDGAHFHIQTIAIHEIGHCLGLAHSNDLNHSMYPCFGMGKNVDLDQADKNALIAIYP